MTERAAAPRWMEYARLPDLAGAPVNPKRHDGRRLGAAIEQFGFADGLILDERTNQLVAGHGRLEALRAAEAAGESPPDGVTIDADGVWRVPVQRGWSSNSDAHARAFLIAHNRLTELGGWDDAELLAELTALDDAGMLEAAAYDADELAALAEYAGGDGGEPGSGSGASEGPTLADRFLIPPFDVLDARQGWWQARKRDWIALGIRSEVGREEGMVWEAATANNPQFYRAKTVKEKELGRALTTAEFLAEHYDPDPDNAVLTGTSIFDPVLAELAIRWFTPPGGAVLDPFAGGSVRGLVTQMLGRYYTGNDLSAPQIAANIAQGADFESRGLIGALPTWSVGDSADWSKTLAGEAYDGLLTCPPYLWLERYGDDPADLSTMKAEAFEEVYTGILTECARALKRDRFAVIVVGDVREERSGRLVDFRGMTIRAAEAAGLALQSAAVLVTVAGSLAVRSGRTFVAGRLLGRTHQDVLVFVKGSRKAAAAACGPVEIELTAAVADALAAAADEDLPGEPGTDGAAPGREAGGGEQ